MNSNVRVLIACGDPEIRRRIGVSLSEFNAAVDEVASWQEFAARVAGADFVVVDVDLPGAGIEEVLREVHGLVDDSTRREAESKVVLVTGPDDTERAVEAMRSGAEDYIARPFRSDSEIALRFKRLLLQWKMKKELEGLRKTVQRQFQLDGLLGKSKPMQDLFRMVTKIAPTEANVLILGESGTGKELLARTVHFNSVRATGRFVAVDCGALTETLLSSELFGHEKGAFTGAVRSHKGLIEEANGGTVFLDEIGNTSLGFQVKLLRVLEERQIQRVGSSTLVPVDVRVLAATNQNLQAAVAGGTFREDLFYRLNVFELSLPPLRERPEDVPLLAHHFLKQFVHHTEKNIQRFTEGALKRMMDYPWPGNVRELENAIERAVILCERDEIDETLLPGSAGGVVSPSGFSELFDRPWHEAQDRFETEFFTRLLERSGWNVSHAADKAGVPRQTVHYKIRKYGLKGRR